MEGEALQFSRDKAMGFERSFNGPKRHTYRLSKTTSAAAGIRPNMPPTHHPSAQALANFLIGDCSPGAALLISRHMDECAQCTARVQAMGAAAAAQSVAGYDPVQVLRPGLEIARLQGVSGLGEAVFELQAAPGQTVSLDEPYPVAEILVLEGLLEIDGETFGRGDFLSLEETAPSLISSDATLGCRCLITCLDTDDAAAI